MFLGIPVFIKNIESHEPVKKDSSVKFECIIDAFPKPLVSWLINGKEVSTKDGVQIEKDSDNNRYSLSIPKVISASHSGQITVKASNSLGLIQQDTILKVFGTYYFYL